jgi:hypothetical protein
MDDVIKFYELRFEQRPGYLYANIKADQMTREIALGYLREIANECARLRCTRLLIERDVPVMMPAGDLFFTATEFLEMIKGVRVAFVNPYAGIEKEMGFAVTISTNRGADYYLFDNLADADKWLLK